ncbi:MAG: hypothetical protein AAGF10_01530, partial [Verrucomicrobiota bacterium]
MKLIFSFALLALLGLGTWCACILGRLPAMGELYVFTTPTQRDPGATLSSTEQPELVESKEPLFENFQPERTRATARNPRALRGEKTLQFDSQEAYLAALEILRREGVAVIDTLPGLNAIRISTARGW